MNSSEKKKSECQTSNMRRCAYCGNLAAVVWVHGHGQCSSCGINIEECCRGEQGTASSK